MVSFGGRGAYPCARVDELPHLSSASEIQQGGVGQLPQNFFVHTSLLGAERSKKGLDGKSPYVRALFANISPKARVARKIGDSNSPLPPRRFPKIPGGKESWGSLDEDRQQRGRDIPSFLLPGKEGSQPYSFLAHRAVLLDSNYGDPASSLHSLSSPLPGKPSNSRRKLSKYL